MIIRPPHRHHSSTGFTNACDFHRDAMRILARRSAVDLELGQALVALFSGDRLLRIGYAKQGDYARERLGVAPRTARQFTRLARGLAERPHLRRAVERSRVSMRKALLVLPVALGDDEEGWTEAAARVTERSLRARIAAGGAGRPGEEADIETLLVRMTPGEQDRLDDAIALANVVLGKPVRKWMAVETIAMEWASGHAAWWPEVTETTRGDFPEEPAPTPPWRIRRLRPEPECRALPTDPSELDERARALAAERSSLELDVGPAIAKVRRHRVWWEFRCGSWEEYVTDFLGMSLRTVRQKLWMESRMDAMPELRDALRSGRLTWTQALFVAKDAEPEDVAERIELAAATTVQQTERASDEAEERQNRAAGVRRLWGPTDAFETVSMAIRACQEHYRTREEWISVGQALARMADHYRSVWEEAAERAKRRVSKKRRAVLTRNRGFCAVPGCTRAAAHDHHVVYRSRGGSDEVSNRIGLCVAHHLRGVHTGTLRVRGVAGERLVWEFGDGERFVTVGDEVVHRTG